VLAVYVLALAHELDASQARALAIVALTAGNVGLAAVNAGAGLGWRAFARREFASFRGVALAAAAMLALGLSTRPARELLQFGPPPALAIAAVCATVLAITILLRRGGRPVARP